MGTLYRKCMVRVAFYHEQLYKLKNSLVSVIGCVINLNCASLKIPWGEFLTSAHLTIENNYRSNCLLSKRKTV